jgi:hypothetical protein
MLGRVVRRELFYSSTVLPDPEHDGAFFSACRRRRARLVFFFGGGEGRERGRRQGSQGRERQDARAEERGR